MQSVPSFFFLLVFLFFFLLSPSVGFPSFGSLFVASAPSFDEVVQLAIDSASQSAEDAKLIDTPDRSSSFTESDSTTPPFEGSPSFFMGGIHISSIHTTVPCEAHIYFFLREPPPIPPALPGEFEPHQSDSFVFTAIASTGESVSLTQAQFDAAGDVLTLTGLNAGQRTFAVEVRDTQTGAIGAQVSWPVTINCPDGNGVGNEGENDGGSSSERSASSSSDAASSDPSGAPSSSSNSLPSLSTTLSSATIHSSGSASTSTRSASADSTISSSGSASVQSSSFGTTSISSSTGSSGPKHLVINGAVGQAPGLTAWGVVAGFVMLMGGLFI